MRGIFSLVSIAAITCLFSGCVPFPNTHYFAPTVTGLILREGSPVAGAEVQLSSAFSNLVESSTTDAQGRFVLAPLRELRLTAILVGDPLYTFRLSIHESNKKVLGYMETGMGYAPSSIELICELSQPSSVDNQQVYCSPVKHR